MKILITGSGGFVGNFLTQYFTDKGISVVGVDLELHPFQEYFNFNFYQADIRDGNKIFEIVNKEKPTHIIHLAWLMKPQHDTDYEYSVDIIGSENIIAAANQVESVRQFIFFSSTSIYGGHKTNPEWITEEQKAKPGEWVYAQYKIIVEDLLTHLFKRNHLNIIILRMCTACGPSYFRKDGLVDLLAQSSVGLLLNGKDIRMQFIHENDVKEVVNAIVHDKKIEGTFNLAPDSFSWSRSLTCKKKLFLPIPMFIFKQILSLLWKMKKTEYSPTAANLMAHSIVASPQKLQEELKYYFQYRTEEAFFDDAKKRGY